MEMSKVLQILTIFVISVTSAPSPKLQTTNQQLTDAVKPSKYTLQIQIAEDFFSTKTFNGQVDINISIENLTTTDSSFQLYANNITINTITLKQSSTSVNVSYDLDPDTDLLTITPETTLTDGSYTLSITYTGTLRNDMVGVYLGSYTDQFQLTKYFVATQFEEIHARKAFPCFDEPQFKAIFSIKISHPVNYYPMSNNKISLTSKKDNITTTTFSVTKKMSTYLVAFIVSQMNCKTGGKFYKAQIELCSRISAMDDSAEFALEKTPQIHDVLAAITNYNYSDTLKLTLAALPQFAPGAMENWGLVTFKESNLLVNQDGAASSKQKVLTTLAHELSHQWFGNLVTLEWWNEMFLNEGFATYFGYLVADQVESSMEINKFFVLEQLQPALYADSLGTSLPLSFDVDNPDFSARTNDLSYNKGASILRMIDQFLGTDIFNNAIADYINTNAYSNVNSDNFWESLQKQIDTLEDSKKPPVEVSKIMENWIKNSGYPIVNVAVKDDGVVISQEQFLLTGENLTQEWYVPITYTTDFHFEDTSTTAWLIPGENLTISEVGPQIFLNLKQTGFYRVNYDDTILKQLSTILTNNIDSINDLNKAQIIDDQFNLLMAKKREYSDVFSFLNFLKSDTSYYSWAVAFKHFNTILQKISDEDVRNAFQDYLINLMDNFYKTVSLDEEQLDNHIYTLTQVLAFGWSCKLRNENCVNYFAQKFQDYVSDASKEPNDNFKTLVYCNGLRNTSFVVTDFQFLWSKFESSDENEKINILKSLGCINDSTLRKNYLTFVLNDSKITMDYAKYVLASVYSNNPEGIDEFLEFITDYYNAIIHKYNASYLISLIDTISRLINTQTQIDKLTKLSEVEGLDSDVKTAIETAVSVATQNYEDAKEIEEFLTDFLSVIPSPDTHSTDGAISISVSLILNVIVIFIMSFKI